MSDAGRISFADPGVARCPFDAYRDLQGTQPVYHDASTGLYEVVGAAEIRKAAADPETFSCRKDRQSGYSEDLRAEIARLYREEGFPPIPTLLNNDGEDHRKLRSLVDRAFTAARINALMPAIRGEVDSLMDACEGDAEFEFVERFAIPLPLNIIADQLGVRREDHVAFKAGSDAMLAVPDPLTPPDRIIGYIRDIIRMQHLLAERVEQVRRQPDETILSVVATNEVDGAPLSVGMMVNLFQNILVAGNETTTNALGNAMQLLFDDPDLMAQLRDEPAQVRAFVEEALRLRAPLQGFYRTVTRDTELGGVPIPAGATVMLRWGAGGRDPAAYGCPAELQLDRKQVSQHMSFGHGVHFCIGNQLARAELRAAIEGIVARWPNIRLASRPDAVVPLPAFFAHGPRKLHVRI